MYADKQKTILFVEDSATYALVEAAKLRGFGYKVITANSGEVAVELAAKDEVINLILMDIELGEGLDGTEAARQILAVRHVPIVFLTAHIEKEYIDRLKTITRYGVVAKNSGEFILQSSIEMALELFEAHRSIERDISERKQAENLLSASEYKYRTLVELAADAIFLADVVSGTIIDCNMNAARLIGRSKNEIIGINQSGLHPPDKVEHYKKVFKDHIESGRAITEDVLVIHKDGHTIPVDIHATVFELDGAKVVLGLFRDITERKQAENTLRESEELLRSITDNTATVIFMKDKAGRYLHVNRQYEKLFHVSNAAIQGKTDHDIFPQEMANAFIKNDQAVIQSGRTIEVEERVPQDDGIHTYLSVKFPIRHISGEIYAVCGIATDITKRKEAEEQIHNLAFYDALTQLPNRRLLNDRLKQAMAASKRSGLYCSLMFMDMDNFKSLNDTQGHVAGDLLLTEAASRITTCVREADTVARFGGDEFLVMLGELDIDKAESIRQTSIVAEKIRNILANPYILTLQNESKAAVITIEHHCAVSIGAVMFLGHESSAEDIIKWADISMYKAKEGGGNMIHFYE